MKTRLFIIFILMIGLALPLVWSAAAQEPAPTLPSHRYSPTPHPTNSGYGNNSHTPHPMPPSSPIAQGEVSAAALGQPGTVFRYVQTFGSSAWPYFADTKRINRPLGLYMDADGELYVTEELGYRVLRYDEWGENTLDLGWAGMCYTDYYVFCAPQDVARDGSGNIWVADGNRVVEYDVYGYFQRQQPSEEPWNSGNDNDRFENVHGITFDSAGRMYVADTDNQRVQVYDFVDGSPVYSTTIGETDVSGGGNSHFNSPYRLAIDSSDRLYVVDRGNNRVQRCTFSGGWSCATFDSGLNNPQGIAVDGSDNVYIADTENARIRECSSAGSCGNLVTDTYWVYDVAVDSAGNVYGSTTWNAFVAKYNSSGEYMGPFVGEEGVPYLTDNYHFNHPRIAIDKWNNIIVLEENGQRLLKLAPDGMPLWSVGTPGVDTGDDNDHFNWPHGVAVDNDGHVYVADGCRVQIFNANGTYSATLGGPYCGTGNYQFDWATGVAVDRNGNIYVSDGNNHRIQIYNSSRVYVGRIGVTGDCSSANSRLCVPLGIEVDTSGNIYVADGGNCRVQKFNSSRVYQMTFGTTGSCTDSLSDISAEDVTVDSQGRVYVTEWQNDRVQVFNSSGAYLTTLGGSWGSNTGQFRFTSGVALDGSGALYVTDFDNGRIQEFVSGVPGWTQVNLNAFGDRRNDGILSLAVFGGQVYAGTRNSSGNGAQLWRRGGTPPWTAVTTDGFSVANNEGIDHLIEFKGSLYAGTWNYTDGGQVWRSDGSGLAWTQVVDQGFGDPVNAEIFRFAVFGNTLYASTWSGDTGVHGTEIWRSPTGNSGSWTRVVANGFGDNNNYVALSMAAYNGYLYAGTSNTTTGGQIWRSSNGNSGSWVQVNTGGFGTSGNIWVSSLAVFNNRLYAGTYGAYGEGSQIWRCQVCDGNDWTMVADDGFGNSSNQGGCALASVNGYLYVTTTNPSTGLEVWRSASGNSGDWDRVGSSGFGDSNNQYGYYGNAIATLDNRLLTGTWNWANGAEVWEKVISQVYLPAVQKSYDSSIAFYSADDDGDGLLNGWELYGYDADGDGIVDVNLPALGANYRHKDIFVEMDYMVRPSAANGLAPNNAVLNSIVASFAAAPVSNPDGVNGIKIHLELDNQVPLDEDLNPAYVEFAALKRVYFDPKRTAIYHYMIWADTYSSGSSSGYSFGIPATDFLVTLGAWNGGDGGTDYEKIGTFIHELGHNLGLTHGGNDHVNYKPNYISIMNYLFQTSGVYRNSSWYNFDYQRFDLPALNEASLNEPAGLNSGSEWAGYRTVYLCPNQYYQIASLGYPIDWNCDGDTQDTGVVVDVNGDGARTSLGSQNNWAHIIWNGGGVIGSRLPLSSLVEQSQRFVDPHLNELTYEQELEIQRWREKLPQP